MFKRRSLFQTLILGPLAAILPKAKAVSRPPVEFRVERQDWDRVIVVTGTCGNLWNGCAKMIHPGTDIGRTEAQMKRTLQDWFDGQPLSHITSESIVIGYDLTFPKS